MEINFDKKEPKKEEKETKEVKASKETGMNLPMILAIAFLLAGIFFVVLSFMKNKDTGKENNTSQPEKPLYELVPDDDTGYSIIREDNIFYLLEEEEEVEFNGKKVKIKMEFVDSVPKTTVGDVVINNYYATSGYKFDDMLILSSTSQYGESLVFFDKNLNKLTMVEDYVFSELKVKEDGTLKGKFLSNKMVFGETNDFLLLNNLEIDLCDSKEYTQNLIPYKSVIEPHYNEVITGKAIISVSGSKVKLDYTAYETVKDRYSKDINGERQRYCVKGAPEVSEQ